MFAAIFITFAVISSAQVSARCLHRGPPCPPEWHHWGTSCYLATQTNFTWWSARAECAKLGGILAVPSSLEENDFIVDDVIPDGERALIDCNDQATEGTWVCEEGGVEVSYRNWEAWESSNVGSEDCGIISRMYGTGRKWHDYHCSYSA